MSTDLLTYGFHQPIKCRKETEGRRERFFIGISDVIIIFDLYLILFFLHIVVIYLMVMNAFKYHADIL